MPVARPLTTTQGGAVRVAAGLSRVVAGSLLGSAWWVVAAIGVLPVATKTTGSSQLRMPWLNPADRLCRAGRSPMT